jgi:hypothetical protein
MLHVYPAGIRKDRIMPWGGPADSGVTGDPTKSTAEIGRMGILFKVNAGIGQYRLIKNPPQPRGGGRPTPGAGDAGDEDRDAHPQAGGGGVRGA